MVQGPGQETLFEAFTPSRFPATRYQGSKRKLLDWIWSQVADLPFDTVLDAFGGTGCVSYLFKCHGKTVTYNDLLVFNHQIGTALIENDGHRLGETAIARVIRRDGQVDYDDFIERTFGGIYFTDEENRWLDVAAQNIGGLRGRYRRALAYYALFQACIAKRPYNLFHRKNLYMRTAEVRRSFGNKATWDRGFEDHFRRAAAEANAAVIKTGHRCRAVNLGAMEVAGDFDLVYIDPPYVSAPNVGVDYHGFYHFLEGLVDYAGWPERVDYGSKHRRLKPVPNVWTTAQTNVGAFRALFRRYADSTLVVSYRSDGFPSPERLAELLGEVKTHVRMASPARHQYVLSRNRNSREVLLIGT
jgi:adenine-specific DNA methylase